MFDWYLHPLRYRLQVKSDKHFACCRKNEGIEKVICSYGQTPASRAGESIYAQKSLEPISAANVESLCYYVLLEIRLYGVADKGILSAPIFQITGD